MQEQTIGRMAERFHLGVDPYFVIALWGLILARTIPMIALSPIFGGKTVITQVKIGIAMILSVTLYPILSPVAQGKLPTQGLEYWGLVMKEVAVGGLIGYVSSLVFMAFESAGHMIDVQRGSAMASVLIPELDIQGPIFSQLQVQMAIVLFFILDLHHIFLRGYYQSFTTLPVFQFPDVSNDFLIMIEQVMVMSGKILLIVFQLTAPILIAIFMVDVVMGVANRIAPQVNVTFLGQPIKAAVGIIMFLAAFHYILRYVADMFVEMLRDLKIIVNVLS
jgi:flagellar biosynthetic protein FliR